MFIPLLNYAKNTSIVVNVGVSGVSGDGDWEYVKTGFLFMGSVYYRLLNDSLWVGATIGYNNLSLDREKIEDDYANVKNISGSGSMIEVTPKVRAFLPMEGSQNVKIFGQVGAGMYRGKVSLEYDYTRYSWYGYYKVHVDREDTSTNFGLNFGAGLTIGNIGNIQFEIIPTFHLVFGDEIPNYFSLRAGVIINP